MAYERNFGNVTYNVLFNPPKYLVASIDAADVRGDLPIFVDNAGPFGGVAGVTKTIPAGSLRHIDQNIETAYAHFYGVSLQKQIGQALTGSVEYRVERAEAVRSWRIRTSVAPRWSTWERQRDVASEPQYARGVQHPRQPRPVAVSRRHVRSRSRGSSARPACS